MDCSCAGTFFNDCMEEQKPSPEEVKTAVAYFFMTLIKNRGLVLFHTYGLSPSLFSLPPSLPFTSLSALEFLDSRPQETGRLNGSGQAVLPSDKI